MLEISMIPGPFKAIEMNLPIPLILNIFLCCVLFYPLNNYGSLVLGFTFSLHCFDYRQVLVIVWTQPFKFLHGKAKGKKHQIVCYILERHTHRA